MRRGVTSSQENLREKNWHSPKDHSDLGRWDRPVSLKTLYWYVMRAPVRLIASCCADCIAIDLHLLGVLVLLFWFWFCKCNYKIMGLLENVWWSILFIHWFFIAWFQMWFILARESAGALLFNWGAGASILHNITLCQQSCFNCIELETKSLLVDTLPVSITLTAFFFLRPTLWLPFAEQPKSGRTKMNKSCRGL